MRQPLRRTAGPAVLLVLALAHAAVAQPRFELNDGDRVAFIGATFVERAARHGHIEAALTGRWPDRSITFRNFGWSGDNVSGESRAYFGPPADGFKHLVEHVGEFKPTVLMLCYGANEAWQGREGIEGFVRNYEALLDAFKSAGARVVLISPPPLEKLGPPLPDPAAQNQNLALYRDAIAELAAERRHFFADLFQLMLDAKVEPPTPMTFNNIHLTDAGYGHAAAALEAGLGLASRRWAVNIDAAGSNIEVVGGSFTEGKATLDAVSFMVKDAMLPPAPPIDNGPTRSRYLHPRLITVKGLATGDYMLRIDGQEVLRASAAQFAAGVAVRSGPPFDQARLLREAINQKEELFFHGHRPQNETYLRGFRKREQGSNAVEIPQFEPLVKKKEQTIATLRVPGSHRYEIVRVGGGEK